MRSLTVLALLRRPRTVLAVWGVVILVLSAIGLGAQSRLGTGSIEAPGTESARASALDEASFGSNESLLVLLEGPQHDLDREGPNVVSALRRHWSAVSPWDPGRAVARLRPRPRRALVLVDLTAGSENGLYGRLARVRAVLHRSVRPPVVARMSGFTVVGAALRNETLRSAALAEQISIPILVVVLLLVFRAPLAAAVPAIVGLATVSASAGVISLLAQKLDLTALAVSTAAMMGLALGVDYSLLIVSRFREETGDGGGPVRAAGIASRTAGRTVLFAGMVLLIAMLVAVLLSPGDLLVSVTVGVTTAVVLSMVSGAVVVPALLLLLGGRIDVMRIGSPVRRSTVLPALAGFATRFAPFVLAASLLVVLVPGLLARDLHTSALNVRVLPPDNPARRDVEEIAGLVGYGYVTPFEIVLHARQAPITEPRMLDAIERFQRRLLDDPAIAGVVGPGALASRTGSVIELPKQIPKLRRQAVRASNGVRQLRNGLLTASQGAGRLRDGAQQAQTGVARLRNGAQQLDTGAAALRSGVQAAASGTHELAQGESVAAAGTVRLRNGASAVHTGSQRLLQGIAAIDAGAADLDAGSRKLAAALAAGSYQMPGSLTAPMAITRQQLRAAYDALTRMTVGRGDASYAAALAAVANAAAVTSGTNPATGAHVASGMPGAIAQASTGIEAMLSDARDLSDGAATLAGNVRQVRAGAATLAGGLAQLEHGQAQLSSGLGDAARRVGAAQTQLGRLIAGAGQLAAGTSRLTNGIGRLSALGQLADGSEQLATHLYQGYLRAAPLAPGLRHSTDALNGFPKLSGQRAAGHMVLAGVQSASAAQRSQLEYVLDAGGAGQGARLFVFPRVFPTTDASAHLHDRLDRETAAFAHATGLDAAVGGPGARFPEFQRVVSAFIPELIAVLSLMTFLLLVAILRALLIPAVAIALNLAITAAAFGLMRVLFQGAHPLLGGPGSIDVTSAAGIFTILFALSLDYQVFLLTRMREGFHRTGEANAAIDHGIKHTARVVTGAAAIMATVFLSFGASTFPITRQLGVGLAIAVLLDALLLRLFMLPAAMHLLGRRGWWIPAWLDRLLPHFEPEGDAGDASFHGGVAAAEGS